MDDQTSQRYSYFFTVRIWPENMGDDRIEWRGRVQYLPGGVTSYFRDWPALLAFLEKIVSKDEDGTGHWPDR